MVLGIRKKKAVGKLRRTQLITTYGSGAIADLPENSVIIAGTDYWSHYDQNQYIIHEPNLEKFLGVDYFVLPKTEEKTSDKFYAQSLDIPAFRFPEILVCQQCGKLANYKRFRDGKKFRCSTCGSEHLIPSRFVAACENGHLEDFPYSWWVHKGDVSGCNNPNDLKIFYDDQGGGLDSIKIYCKSCKKTRSMTGCFSPDALVGSDNKCRGNRPWLRDIDPQECDKALRTVQRGASNLYFGVQMSALTIPPWSGKIQQEISKKWDVLSDIASDDDLLERAIKKYNLTESCKCSMDDIKKQIRMKKNKEEADDIKSYEDIIQDEYRALVSGENKEQEYEAEETDVPEFLRGFIDKIVLVSKVREVMALRGFKRIKPDYDINDEKTFTKLGKTFKNWLPAIELRGEGIFVKLNDEEVRKWEERVGKRYKILLENFEKSSLIKSGIYKSKFSTRYILLHTLSHLLIRQLTLQCGYSSAAVKERVYSTFNSKEDAIEMAGILIYTASPDSEGSLGGLVREGKTENIENTFKNMLEEASWCSSDPLCIQSGVQGFEGLNFAACHSCTLLPETSCEARNCFLDRASVIGIDNNSSLGFLNELFYKEED